MSPARAPTSNNNASSLQPNPNVPGPRTLLDSSQRENAGITCRDVCWLFCCPPWPSSIAAKLAFVPPEASYKFVVASAEGTGTTLS
ncbi:hypothetical protein BV898_08739 [Hypsibius exemplaris]|uniref:Uncharacterized protein n=1 Tax=Hypsibius exemplaris TaxID=2072580 RepID=A0A1W0WPQ1_HYPEX|nr:hypothetical protein BV898_08739 [Hypsibius exemplaris]